MLGKLVDLSDRLEAWWHRNEDATCAVCWRTVRRRDMVDKAFCSDQCAESWASETTD